MRRKGPGLGTGLPALDRLLAVSPCIVCFRHHDPGFLSRLAGNIAVLNHEPGRRMLYLHWVDYHQRYWTLDADRMVRLSKRCGMDPDSLSEDLHFMRAFSRDNTETEANWRMIKGFADEGGLNLVILDSVSELRDAEPGKAMMAKPMAYALGRFVRLCMVMRCFGVILDSSARATHPLLGDLSSVIIEFRSRIPLSADLLKHPCLPESSGIDLGTQRTLRGWLG
jgi:hypothetical protein